MLYIVIFNHVAEISSTRISSRYLLWLWYIVFHRVTCCDCGTLYFVALLVVTVVHCISSRYLLWLWYIVFFSFRPIKTEHSICQGMNVMCALNYYKRYILLILFSLANTVLVYAYEHINCIHIQTIYHIYKHILHEAAT